ncbi:MAG TPA: Crp/Fnr family transcriptional regulator [Clostridia bacterium]|nr:Crp/Fnr family transcriptional regulator [Clostridia bacterium]
MRTIEELVSGAPVFSKLTPAQRKQLLELTVERNYRKGEIIILQGTVWPYAMLVIRGLIRANKESPEGRCLSLRSFVIGSVFWGHGLFGEYCTPATLVAYKPTTILRWAAKDLLSIITENNEALWDLCLQLSQRMMEASQTITDIAFSPVASRLARLLVDQFEAERQTHIERKMTLEEMATTIGSTREVVCRLLYRFSDKNMIQVDRSRFILVDREELNKLAEGEIVLTKE